MAAGIFRDMVADPPLDYAPIDELLDAGDLDLARATLDAAPADDERYSVLRLKLALLEGSLPPGAVMQQLIHLMRRNAGWPKAKELYQRASQLAFSEHESSTAHSHPPPSRDDA